MVTDNTQKHHAQSNNTLDTLLYADDQALFANDKDVLQYSVHHLNLQQITITWKYHVFTTETKVMVF
jgi:hypothetical protein